MQHTLPSIHSQACCHALYTTHWHQAEAGVTDPLGLGELLHGLLEVAEGPLHNTLVLLEVVQQHVPQRLLCKHLGVAQDDYAILGPGQGYIETPRVTEETNSLQKVCTHK